MAAEEATGYGGFRLGRLELALPMAALREVLPCSALHALPCRAHGLVGGITLRGVSVPVVDLRVVLGLPTDAHPPYPSAIVMVHQGRLLGLLVDGVTGVFSSAPGSFNPSAAAEPGSTLLAGSICRADDQALVSVLSPAALAALPQLPLVEDPEPHRAQLRGEGQPVALAPASVPVVLMRCGPIRLAIDAMSVHATLSFAQLQRSVLAVGHCRGVIDFGGTLVPALDLLALCGLGTPTDGDCTQAVVLRLEAGLVAFLVDEVVDVVATRPDDVIPVPAFALAQPAFFSGALPITALPAELAARTGAASKAYLKIDAAALGACPDVVGLASANTRTDGAAGHSTRASAASARRAERRNMITYALCGEMATPVEQVAEILPYQPEASLFGAMSALLGMVVNRGRAIPILCLSRLAGLPAPEATPDTSVLVVASDGDLVGFAVPRLKSIEAANWPMSSQVAAGGEAGGAASGPLDTRGLALVGSGESERLLKVMDLQQLAREVRASGQLLSA